MKLTISLLRLLVRAAALSIVTAALLPLQAITIAIATRGARWIPVLYHRLVCRILSVRVREIGKCASTRPLLIVSNHVSWLDISVITSAGPVSFVAKREVASWPVFGLLAKLQRSIFVDRERRLKSVNSNSEIASRLLCGDVIVLFAEGTSGDGKNVLPFRSALIGSAAQVLSLTPEEPQVFMQPLSVAYTGGGREIAPWHGDMDLLPHLAKVLRTPKIEVVLSWGAPVAYDAQTDRKEMARALEGEVRALTLRAVQDFESPVQAA
jgi:1-acyl-sn-glycerol-3-phosphate acyltransferase